jgi:Zn-dependent peptidase ImmA (M78 family)
MSWREDVWRQVEDFRERYVPGDLAHVPLDMISITELELRLDLIPFDDLYTKFNADAAITADFSGIYVDAETYELIDAAPEWKLNRLRFSIAHEVGHWMMHRHEFAERPFSDFSQFARWTWENGGRKYDIEREANEFAGRLLVPIDQLRSLFDEFAKGADEFLSLDWRLDPEIRRSAAKRLSQKFGVHADAMLVRFDREELWREPFH